jgi:hypothetical protein
VTRPEHTGSTGDAGGPGVPDAGRAGAPARHRVPASVICAALLVVLHVVAGVFTALIVIGGDRLHTLQQSGPSSYSGFTTDVYARGVTPAAITVAVLVQLLYLVFAVYLFRRRNWARVVLWLVSGVGVLGWFVSLGSPVSLYSRVEGIGVALVNAAIIGTLATDSANEFFAPIDLDGHSPVEHLTDGAPDDPPGGARDDAPEDPADH